jgi:threonine dehydrogenase-like Zn-dependent dehydrogenase
LPRASWGPAWSSAAAARYNRRRWPGNLARITFSTISATTSPAEISKLTGGRGADLVFDATYSEPGFVQTANTVRQGGSWIVLGVGPGKTTRVVETESPVDSILAERGAKHININLLRYFSEPATVDDEAKTFLQRGMTLAMEWAVQGLVVPYVGSTIDSTVEAINAGLRSLKAGTGTLGKVAVIVDRDLVEG